MVSINLLPMDFKLSLHNVLFGQSEFLATEQAYLKICVLVPIQHIFVPAPGPDGYPLPDPTRTFFFLPEPDPENFSEFQGSG